MCAFAWKAIWATPVPASVLTFASPAGKYWVAVQRFASKLSCSFLEAQHHEAEEVETVTALASLSVAVMVEKR